MIFEISGYEFKVIEILKRSDCKYPIISGPFLIEKQRHAHSISYDLLVDPLDLTCADIIGESYLKNIRLNNEPLSEDEFRRYMCKFNKYETSEFYPEISIKMKDNNC